MCVHRRCKEVKCKQMNFNDGYGQWLERSNVCYNNYASVVVMVTDTCACHYPNNYHSNKRWCCMDMYHLDMSVWAYEKVGGVTGLVCHGTSPFAAAQQRLWASVHFSTLAAPSRWQPAQLLQHLLSKSQQLACA